MKTIEITDAQYAYLEQLRSDLEEHVIGRYGTCRNSDALRFLIDNVDDDELELAKAFDTNALPDDDEFRFEEDDGRTADGPVQSADGATDDEILDQMMNLLDTHEDKWTESPSSDYRYRVDLADGGTEDVQTKDDVRAILFREYR